ncbi:MAG TPA: hypothetical protein VGF67_18815 [Ktedonobacteraceae bacterium]|jgi:hypothetical protein
MRKLVLNAIAGQIRANSVGQVEEDRLAGRWGARVDMEYLDAALRNDEYSC